MPDPGFRRPLWAPTRNRVLFAVLAVLGVAASYLTVTIPNTPVHIEGRFIFGMIGFALLNRWWQAALLAAILSLAGPHHVALHIAFIGNMIAVLPTLLVFRILYPRFSRTTRNVAAYGIAWFLTILACYQVFTTPLLWGYIAYLSDAPIIDGMLTGVRDQPYIVESLIVGAVTSLSLTVVRVSRELESSRDELATTLYSIGDGVISTDSDCRVNRMNPEAERATGFSEAEAVGKDLESVFHIVNEYTRKTVENPARRVLQEGRTVGLANHTVLISRYGEELPILDSGAPIRDREGVVSGVVIVFRDQTNERNARKEIDAGHERLRLALEKAVMGIWDWEISTGRVAWDGEHHSLFGIPLEQFGGTIDDVQARVHPDDREQGMREFRSAIENNEAFDNQYRVVWPNGTIRWLSSYGRVVFDSEGKPERIVGTTQDITDAVEQDRRIRKTLAEKEALIRELYHRTKNTMHLIQSMLALGSEGTDSDAAVQLAKDTHRRIQAIALVHDKLYQAHDLSSIVFADYIDDLVDHVLHSHVDVRGRVSVELDLEPVSVLIDTAVPLGLAVNELLTNAFVHGFPGEERGTVKIRLVKRTDGTITLTISDDGVGVPTGFDFRCRQTLGLQTVVALVEHQLQGTIEFHPDSGVSVEISFKDNLYEERV